MFQLQKLSNFGTSTPAVARTFLQGSELLGSFESTEKQKDACKTVLLELQRHLVKCVEIHSRVSTEIQAELKPVVDQGLKYQSGGRAISLPGVADIHSSAEAFLQSAKLAIRETARLVEPFYKTKQDHKFHKFASWAETQFGFGDNLAKAIRLWEPWVKSVVTLRNAVDHPSEGVGGKLVVHNFRLAGSTDTPSLIEPMWGLSGGQETPLCSDMASIVEGTIVLGEDILVGLFYKFKPDFPLVIYEIPSEQRDPKYPKRLRIGLASEKPDA